MLTFVIDVLFIMFQICGRLSLRCLPSFFCIIFKNLKLAKIKTNFVFFLLLHHIYLGGLIDHGSKQNATESLLNQSLLKSSFYFLLSL